MTNGNRNFNFNVSGQRTTSSFDSSVYFKDLELSDFSPVQRFVEQRQILTRILGSDLSSQEGRMKANLVTIGIVSSVETYFRSIIRKCLLIDDVSRSSSYHCTVSYGAALYHIPELLPEALLEESTFLNKKHLINNINSFLGLQLNPQNNADLENSMKEYEKVCHLRHCIVHRSGHLGSKNAIALGLETFYEHLEKPITLDFDSINNIFNICQNVVLEFNDEIFKKILNRTVDKGLWTGDLRVDKKHYKPIYKLFSPEPSDDKKLKSSYKEFITQYGIK